MNLPPVVEINVSAVVVAEAAPRRLPPPFDPEPKLKRSPYLAAMCAVADDSGRSWSAGPSLEESRGDEPKNPPRPRSPRASRRAGGDFFDLQRPTSTSASASSAEARETSSRSLPLHGASASRAQHRRRRTTAASGPGRLVPPSRSLQYYAPGRGFSRNNLLLSLVEDEEGRDGGAASTPGRNPAAPSPAPASPTRAAAGAASVRSLPATLGRGGLDCALARSRFFPSTLDPLDGRDEDLNRRRRNEAWKEICGGGDSEPRRIGERDEEEGGEEEEEEEEEEKSSDRDCYGRFDEELEPPHALPAPLASRRASDRGPSRPRRCRTVGAGLSYGRMSDWHLRPRSA